LIYKEKWVENIFGAQVKMNVKNASPLEI